MLSIFKKTQEKHVEETKQEFVKKNSNSEANYQSGSGSSSSSNSNVNSGAGQSALPKIAGGGSFGGMSADKITKTLNNKKSNGSNLTAQVVSEAAAKAIEEVNKSSNPAGIKVVSSDRIFEEASTMYAEGEIKATLELLRQHIISKRGEVDKKYWFMLMDIYQINNQRLEFEKAALLFAQTFSTSPPSWPQETADVAKNNVTGKNLIILTKLNDEDTQRIKEFIKAAKEEKFCRIDVSKVKFEESNLAGFNTLLNTMYELRKAKVLSVLLGETHLVSYIKQYMSMPDWSRPSGASLNQIYVQNETLFWLMYLEVMQWKNRPDEFDDAAINYAVNFELSAPGWDNNGVMRIESSIIQQQISQEEQDTFKISKVVTHSNIEELFVHIEATAKESSSSSGSMNSNSQSTISIDLNHVDRFDFASAGSFLNFLQTFSETYPGKRIQLVHPNELVICLFETIGLIDLVQIVAKTR